MKKYLRYVYATIVTTIGLMACNPADPDQETPVDPSIPEAACLATATIEPVSGYTTNWEEDSRFTVGYSVGGSAKTIEFSITEGKGTSTGKFSYAFNGRLPAPSYALFPASLVNSAGSSISECSLIWPTEQKYGDPSTSKVPMWAKCDGLNDLNGPYRFQSIGGILHVSVTGTGSITKVRLISEKPLSGEFHMNESGDISFEEGKKSVYYNIDLEGRGNINLSDKATEFFFTVPSGYYSGLTVEFFGDGGCSYSHEVKGLVEIGKGRVSSIVIDGVKGYGAGKLLRVDAEHDVTYDNIKEALIEKAPQLKPLAGIFDMALKMFIANNTQISRIIYLTPGRDGQLIEASGLIACQYYSKPGDVSYDRIVSIQHGTCDIDGAPSYQTFYPEITPASIRGNANIIVMADYLGYGASRTNDLQHPYLSKELTGSCCADMLAAAEEFIAGNGLDLTSDKIDLVGYSQGGAATLATLLELERRGDYDGRINEVWAGAGPYDIIGFFDSFKSKETYDKTGFVPYTFRGICYGEHLTVDYDNIFNPSLIEKLEKDGVDLETLFSTRPVNEWHSILGYSIKDILHPDFYKDGYGGNSDIIALVKALEKNSIVKHDAPKNLDRIKFYHSVTDETVPYSCSEALQSIWGFPEIIKLQAKDNHLIGGVEFLLDYCGLGYLTDIIIPLVN